MMRRHATWMVHVAQLRISLCLTLAKFSVERQYAVAYVPGSFRDFPAPRSAALVCTASARFWPRLWRRVKDNAPYHRFSPASSFATYVATEDEVKDQICFPPTATAHQQKTAKLYQNPFIGSNRNSVFINSIAWKIYPLIPYNACSA